MNKNLADYIFLIDAIGACVSGILLCLIFKFQYAFGMPEEVLLFLLPIPAILGVFSLMSHYIKPSYWPVLLMLIAIANLTYGSITLVFCLIHYKELTVLGWTYFTLEFAVLLLLAIIEIRISQRKGL